MPSWCGTGTTSPLLQVLAKQHITAWSNAEFWFEISIMVKVMLYLWWNTILWSHLRWGWYNNMLHLCTR